MQKGFRNFWSRLGRVEKTFLAAVLLYAFLRLIGVPAGLQVLAAITAIVCGMWSLFRVGAQLMRKAIWRLRNRLIVAYLFIAVVPIVLILTLALITGYALVGSVAVYFVRTELANREAQLLIDAQRIAERATPRPERPAGNTPGANPGRSGPPPFPGALGGRAGTRPPGSIFGGRSMPRPPLASGTAQSAARQAAAGAATPTESFSSRMATLERERLPEAEILVRTGQEEQRFPATSKITAPGPEWGRASGLILKSEDEVKRVYLWAHANGYEFGSNAPTEVTILMPITAEMLSDLVPKMADVSIVDYVPDPRESRVPKRVNMFDFGVINGDILRLAVWESPTAPQVTAKLAVSSRISAILGKIYEQKAGQMSLGEVYKVVFYALIGLFLFVEIASLWAGIRLTRSITGSVHELYEGTRYVKEGDFKHRIPVKGQDQLAELGSSFNTMTENLGQLIVVAKEKERLESELEIAREVQKQLFPRDTPSSKTLQLTGVCKPARVVSGDYYDFLALPDSELAFAIGDVAGKGISAALLMATIQSTMRTQLNNTNGNSAPHHLSAARMVAQLNRQLYANTTPEKYATFYFALYDEASHNLTYTNAGHLSPLLLRNGDFQELCPTGTVVGAFPFAKYEERCIELEKGDIVVAYTDGIVEPENPYGEMFGENRMKEIIVRNAYADSSEIIAKVMEAVTQWTGEGELQDDMTMVVARRV
jgi:phosphoserine phosphatase RsbU/P